MPDPRLILFVKAPRIGTVKTRLAATLGPAAACDAYRQLTETLLTGLIGLTPVEVRFSPDDGGAEIQGWVKPGWTSAPQGAGDLGERMGRAFADAFARGERRVVLIGSDCPEVTAGDIVEAWSRLEEADVVLGPATDGGYWLIGLRGPQPMLFDQMPWSTAAVLAETLRRAEVAGLTVSRLRTLTDVDTEADWNAWRRGCESAAR
jgi:uncharacterized protein